MDAAMFSSSLDGSMSSSMCYPVSKGGDGILMKPPPPPSFSSGRRPPLLPLPTNLKPYSSSPLPVVRSPNNKRGRRALSSSPPTNSKKPLNFSLPSSKSSTSPKKQDPKSQKEPVDNRLGPEPSDIPKQVYLKAKDKEEEDGGLNSIFSLAPPPSSLPLPNFFLKPKLLGCNVQAVNLGGMEDDGATATDNLRRLLRLC